MNRRAAGVLLILLLAAPCIAQFQDQIRVSDSELKKTVSLQTSPQMYEDIEVMRRILNRSLHLPRHGTHSAWVPASDPMSVGQPMMGVGGGLGALGGMPGLGNLGGQTNLGGLGGMVAGHNVGISSLEYPGAEGAYLKGHGIVYNVILPPQKQIKPSAAGSSAKPLSDWERARKEVRGEKAELSATEKKPQEPSILDVFLKALAENGKHFSQLGPEETVTIVVTFRPAEGGGGSSSAVMIDPGLKIINADMVNDGWPDIFIANEEQQAKPNTQGSSSGSSTSGEGAGSGSGAAKDKVILGDLQFKQGKYADAVKAYSAALKQLEDKKNSQDYVNVCTKLAQALLADNKPEQAMEYLRFAVDKKITAPTETKKEATPPPLPAKLIISASKKLLDQVGSGKLSFDDFRKEVSVETFGDAEKK